ncbi:MAG: NAD(P)H-hydrate dehydratase [Oscillospiraceae bacterium]|nr:NAD(P)H-hydrate dehydratase [Oscillospiraceae bacterium]
MYICTPEQMKQAEANADTRGVSYLQLMENAGKFLAEHTAALMENICGKQILLLCGKGNNGGDGFVAARYLAQMGACVTVCLTHGEPAGGIALENFQRLRELANPTESIEYQNAMKNVFQGTMPPESHESRVKIVSADSDEDIGGDDFAGDVFTNYDIIVDCVFGTGFHGSLPEKIVGLFDRAGRSNARKIAADVPSGVNCRDGSACEGAFKAEVTVTCGELKIGLLLPPGKTYCGKTVPADIGMTDDDFEKIGFVPRLTDRLSGDFLPPRGEFSHKGCFGRLGIIAGAESMSGAAALNVLGALRSGAGIVRIASVKTVLDRIMSGIYECMGTRLCSNSEGFISSCDENINKLHALAEQSDIVAIGSGMGKNPDTQRILTETVKICRTKKIPLIIDGDGLNCLAECIDIISAENKADFPLILTPHPAELARLLGVNTSEVLADRLAAAAALSEKTGAVVAAKGYPTYTVSPEGRAAASFSGNGGLSRGGSGDLLTGVISGLAAGAVKSGRDMFDIVSGGVYIFGIAADITAGDLSMTGMLPSDAANRLCAAYKIIEKEKSADS